MKQPELGRKIAELRKLKGLTQEELVGLCNISVRTIQRIETGEVTPRSYTVKTILSALGHDLNEIYIDDSRSHNLSRWLNVAWLAGIGYFILGFPEGSMDTMRLSQYAKDYVPGFDFLATTDFSREFYIVVKIFVVFTFFFFQRGFILLGSVFNNSLLRITAIVLISGMIVAIIYDIVSLYYESSGYLMAMTAMAITFGVLFIVFGVALIKLYSELGVFCVLAGILEIIAGCFFLFVSPIGFIFQMPAELFEIIIIYKSTEFVKSGKLGTT